MTRPLDRNGLEGAIKDKAGLNAVQDVTLLSRPSSPTPVKVLSLQKSAQNTEALPWRITSDITAAAATAGVVSPIITMIDRYFVLYPHSCPYAEH